MARIVIAGNAVMVKSDLRLEDIKTIKRYRPKALTLMGGESGMEPIFGIGLTDGAGSINEVGVSFGRADADGKAIVTMVMEDAPAENVKEWVADKLGGAMMNLNALESMLPAVLADILANKAKVMEGITMAG